MRLPINILLIEDDGDDVQLLTEALDDNNVEYNIDVVSDGGLVAGHVKNFVVNPDIIILDFNLPRVHGRELLRFFKSSAALGSVPVVILTTSNAQEDIDYALREGAEKYLIKPSTVQGINDVISSIMDVFKKSSH